MLQEEELRLITKSRQIHEKLIDHISKDKIPDDVELQSVLIRALGSLDKNIASMAKLRVEAESAKNEAATREKIAELILAHKSRPQPVRAEPTPALPDSLSRENKVDGEDMQGASTTTYSEFVSTFTV